MRKRAIVIGIGACVVALVVAGLCVAQPPAGGGQGARGQRGAAGGPGQRGRFDPAQMRQMMIQRMKEQLDVDDQAWKVMEPRLLKVMELNRQASGFGRGGMFFGGMRRQRPGDQGREPGGRQGAQGAPERELTPIDKATTQLRTTLENESASAEEIKKQLRALRDAREKAKQALAVAQQELRMILTVRQEAQLVLMQMLN